MPFTHEQFLDVFARYNAALWPAAVILWLLSIAALVWLVRGGATASSRMAAVLAIQWAWAGAVYHEIYFAAINPAAQVFAALFIFEFGMLAWFGVARPRLRFSTGRSLRHIFAFAFIAYGLLYPALGLAFGLAYPRMPTFGVPCPTTLLTAGFLLAADRPLPRLVGVVPVIWALVGGSAAYLLHVPTDWALLVAAVAMAVHVGGRAVVGETART